MNLTLDWKLINSTTNAPITGGAASTALKIRRLSDGYLYDWNDSTFKAAAWTTLAATMTEVDAVNLPGIYEKSVTITAWTDGYYGIDGTYSGSHALYAQGEMYIADGMTASELSEEIKDKTDNLPLSPAAVGSNMGSVTSVTNPVTVGTNSDKTGYALTTGEHTLISGTDVPAALTAQGYTTTRAGYLDTLNGLVANIWGYTSRTLTAFGTLATDVWSAATRTLTAFGFTTGLATQSSVNAIAADVAILTGGAGARAVTLQLYVTSTTTPIPDVTITVYDNGANLVASATSDAAGQATVALSDGAHTVRMRKAGVVFAIEAITISGDGAFTLYGDAVVIPSPTVGDACTLYEYCYDQASDEPLDSVTATAKIVNLPYDYNGKLHEGTAITGTYDDTAGVVSWEIVKGAVVYVTITELGVAEEVTIPDASNARLSDL